MKRPAKSTAIISTILILSVLFRLSINYSTSLIPKVNGAYYLVQTRSILETGNLAFSELPLVFYIEALGSKLLNYYGQDLSSAILNSVKLTDSVMPSLQVITIFLLILFWKKEKKPAGLDYFYASAGVIFSIANFQSVSMISDFQKNSIGLMWFAFYIYYLKEYSDYSCLKNSLLAGLFFFLTALTHIGVFSMALAFSLVLFLIRLSVRGRLNKKTAAKSLVMIAFAALLLFLGMHVLPNKFTKLVSYLSQPLQLFDKPLIFERMDPLTLFALIFLNGLTIITFVLVYRKRKQIDTGEMELAVAAAATTLLLASPFIGRALAERFYLLALGPSIILCAFVFNNSKFGAKLLAASMVLIMLIFTPPTLAQVTEPSIPEDSVAELVGLKSEIEDARHSLIITKHGLEWWSAWFLRTDVSQEFGLSSETWKEYRQVFFLKELGNRKSPFPEIRLPADAKSVYQGKYFQLYTARKVPDFYPLPKPQ